MNDFGFVEEAEDEFGFVPDSEPESPAATRSQFDREFAELKEQSEARDRAPFDAPKSLLEAAKFGWEQGNEEAAKSPLGIPSRALAMIPRVDAQTVQNAYDAVAGPLDSPVQPPSELSKIIAGSVNVGRGVGESLASPLGVATLGMGALPPIGQKALTGAFLADMASHVPEQARELGEASVGNDTQRKVEAVGNLGATALFGGAMGAHLASPRAPAFEPSRIPALPPEPPIDIEATVRTEPPIVRVAEESGAKAGLNKSVEALKETKTDKPATPESDFGFVEEAQKGLNEELKTEASIPERLQGVGQSTATGETASKAGGVIENNQGQPSIADQVAAAPTAGDFSTVKTTENAWDFGRVRNTPEGIAELEAIKAGIDQQMAAIKADPNMAPMDKLNARSALVSGPSHFIKEAISAAKGETDRPAMTEYLSKKSAPEPIKAVEPVGAESTGITPETAGVRPETIELGSPAPAASFEPALAESGMGGMRPGERLKSPLAGVADSLKTLAEQTKPGPSKAFDLGESAAKLKDRVSDAAVGLETAAQYLNKKLEGKPEWNTWKDALGERHLNLSESAVNARKFVKTAQKAIPDKVDREAISNWIDTGGDASRLADGAANAPDRYKPGYERAANLTPEQKVIAQNIREYFEKRLEDAQEAGILEDGIENYLHRTYEKDSDFKKGAIAELRSGLFSGKPGLAKQRVFEYDLDAEKAGLKPVKDFIQRTAQYDLALNKAIADRAAIKSMMEIKMPDGRPMIDVGGGGKTIEAPAGEKQATLINRSAKKFDETDPKVNRGDFKSFDHPALRKWKWVMNDAEGKPVFVQGDVLVHPDAVSQIEKLLGKSRIRQHPIGRGMLNLSSTIKQTMLDLSGFHQVQIGVHGFEHKTFKPVKEIDFTDPDVRGLIKGGAVVGETGGSQMFSEGLSGSSLTKHVPWVGERIQKYQSYLFEDYIPRLKTAMGLHALERNRERFPNLSKEELYHLTANQMNAAFGELNYEMMGRSKTMQDALRLTLLAPDFLEARASFAGQAATKYGGRPNINEKTGRLQLGEQGGALLLGAATMYITARILNKFLDDEYHFEPKNAFNVVYKGKSYGLRTVQGDLIHAVTEPGKFINHRLNPAFGKPVLETLTGRDYFGRKRNIQQRLEDIASTPIPISLKGLFSGREQTLFESFLNGFGLVEKRDTKVAEVSKLADDWRDSKKIQLMPGEFIYDPEKDPYRDIKLAAEFYDDAAVRSEVEKLVNDGVKKSKIREHFTASANRNFTGRSAMTEREFFNSLNESQKKAYQKAKEERRKIRDTVNAALR